MLETAKAVASTKPCEINTEDIFWWGLSSKKKEGTFENVADCRIRFCTGETVIFFFFFWVKQERLYLYKETASLCID